jgi:hypothetical protein
VKSSPYPADNKLGEKPSLSGGKKIMTCVGQLICDNNYRPFSLTYPTAPFSSNKTEEDDKGFNPRISFSAGAVVLGENVSSAIENHLSANNLKIKLGLDGITENKNSSPSSG